VRGLTTRPADVRGERGQVLVLAMLAMAVLLGVSALAVDYGRWLVAKRDLQNEADAAVLAGAGFLETGSTGEQALARQAAWVSIRDELGLAVDPAVLGAGSTVEGAPVQAAGYRIWVSSPAADAGADYPGRYGGDRTVFVRIERDDRPMLAGLLTSQPATIGAWATAGRNRYRFAVQLLCPMGDARCPGNVRDLKIAGGTHGSIRVVQGDVGSNWGLQVTAASAPGLLMADGTAFLMDPAGGGWDPPPWTTGGINPDATPHGPNVDPEPLGELIDVPAWNLPAFIDTTAGSACAASDCVPLRADVQCGGGGKQPACGTIVGSGTTGVTCGPDALHLAPGTYDRLEVRSGCVILDPAPPGYATCTQTASQPVPAAVGLCRGQTPGIFRIRGSLSIGSGQSAAYVIGDGVSLVLDTGARVSVGNSGGLVLGTGNTPGTTLAHGAGAWTTAGGSPWPRCALTGSGTGECVPDASYAAIPVTEMGLAVYVRPAGISDLSGGCGTTIADLTLNGSFGIQFEGAFFAPCTNLSLGASPYQGSVGALVAWTLIYNGQGQLEIAALTPAVISPPYLLEPTLGQ
jgi:hypothetical protein